MAQYHNLSHASLLFHGDSGYAPGISKWLRDGQPVTAPFRYDWDAVAPALGQTTMVAGPQTLTVNNSMNMNGSLVTGGIAVADVPRTVTVSTATMGTAGSLNVYGADYYGENVIEKIGYATAVSSQTVTGKKAMSKVFAVVPLQSVTPGAGAGVKVGFSNVLGLPFCLAGAWDVLTAWADTTALTVDGTQCVAGDTNTATAKTGDVRGTFLPSTLPDGSRKFRIWFTAANKDTRNNLYGLPQYGF